MALRISILFAAAAVTILAVVLPAEATSTSTTYFPRNCGHLAYKPSTVGISCGDGTLYVTGVKYTSWTSQHAAGSGSGHYNNCSPSCAGAHFQVAPLTLKLSHPHYCARLHKQAFLHLDYHFTVAPAAGYPRSGSATYRCSLFH